MQALRPWSGWPLLDADSVRQLEPQLQLLSQRPLMESAGCAAAQLAMAIAPHARLIWIAAGPGHNGGDGLEAARLLHQWGNEVIVSLMTHPHECSPQLKATLQRAQDAGVRIQKEPPEIWLQQMDERDLCIDALLGIGACRPLGPDMRHWLQLMQSCPGQVLAIDVPTGLNPRSGHWLGHEDLNALPIHAHHTLCLIAAQAGLFMGHGRDACGQIWLEDLGYRAGSFPIAPSAWLNMPYTPHAKHHASHKGSHGDVAVVGGEAMAAHGMGMTGAAVLAATAALHAGAGRVYLSLLGAMAIDNAPQDVMQRPWTHLDLEKTTVVCGCGAGKSVIEVLPPILQRSAQLVLDADGLNALAHDKALQTLMRARAKGSTVITPHPLEAARLLGTQTLDIQSDRLKAAQQLADQLKCTVVLKGSGTVIAAPECTPHINPTGNGRLATGGTGDVLAGLIGARMAQGLNAFEAACSAVAQHGQLADDWPAHQALTASRLAQRLT
ncbi:NAD(P)H-hydrate dehydratase [Limnohabitans sp. 2KL-3]|uniref:NAD(P)H-hydrate dehydratase n=1 Tax=Limnohabitans sp. 2KL-3 TaxID=1100700 RepID=UPI000A77D1D8|nr:NAD(P)H-hydrate dehydratase [Limnohabitans sp. 2KL-3]